MAVSDNRERTSRYINGDIQHYITFMNIDENSKLTEQLLNKFGKGRG